MRVNIITNHKTLGLNQDVQILVGMLTAIFQDKVELKRVNYMLPECSEAEYNFFIEVVNPSLFSYAKKNILIPNFEWYYRGWLPYLHLFDEVWCKTSEAFQICNKLGVNSAKQICWSSIDRGWFPDAAQNKKNYHKAFVPVGKNIYRYPKLILQAYMQLQVHSPELYSKLPTLYIVYSPAHIKLQVPDSIQDKVELKTDLSNSDYEDLIKECGLCVCISVAEGFCHGVSEAMSVGCNLIVSDIPSFGEMCPGVLKTKQTEVMEQPNCIGTLIDTSVNSLIGCLIDYMNRSFREKRVESLRIREQYEQNHQKFLNTMRQQLLSIQDIQYKIEMPPEKELPCVSILTLTHNRRVFMPLAKYLYLIQTYPEDKLEWVIVDDGDDSIEDCLIGIPNVKYVRCENRLNIGEKRNLAVKNAMYDVLVMMDDDDVYPNNSVLQRVAMMLALQKQCGFCTTIPCYDITKFVSFMNVPPMQLSIGERVSEATLVFTRAFWEQKHFDEINIAEGNMFVTGREKHCVVLSPQEIIVSLIHPGNTSARKSPEGEPNGCHYGFNEQLFAMVTQIGEEIKKATSCGHGGDGELPSQCGGDVRP